MPYCPKCRSEFVEGMDVCPVCDVPLVDELPPDVRFMSAEELKAELEGKQLVVLRRGYFDNMRELHLLLLEHQVANVIEEYADSPDGYTKLYELYTAEDRAAEAVAIIEEYWLSAHPETAEADEKALGIIEADEEGKIECPACGTRFDASLSECPECGLFVGGVPADAEMDEEEPDLTDMLDDEDEQEEE